MAMMLPIMVGLQMAISVAELEQGELALQARDGKVFEDLAESQKVKKHLLDEFKLAFGDLPSDPCPTSQEQVNGFTRSYSGCVFFSDLPQGGYISRVFPGETGWSYCFVANDPAGRSASCPEED